VKKSKGEKDEKECNQCVELKQKIALMEQQNQSLSQQLQDISQRNLYLLADFENYKRQMDKRLQSEIEHANEKLLRDLLTIVDDLERAITTIKNDDDRKGLLLVYNNLMNLLKKYEVQRIECLGKQIDPNLHEVLIQENSPKEEGVVLEEFQKGYTYKNRVLRYSKVKVSKHIDENKKDSCEKGE